MPRKKAAVKAAKPEPKPVTKKAPVQLLDLPYLKQMSDTLTQEILLKRSEQRAIKKLIQMYERAGAVEAKVSLIPIGQPTTAEQEPTPPPSPHPKPEPVKIDYYAEFAGTDFYFEGQDGKWVQADPAKYAYFEPGDRIKIVRNGAVLNLRSQDKNGTLLEVVRKGDLGLETRFLP